MSAPPVLEVRGLTKRFRGLVALDGVDFAVPEGAICGLIGPNGAGKSTLFNLVTGFLPPSEGEIRFRGAPVTGWSPQQAGRSGIARAFQIARPFPGLTVRQNVRIGALFGRSGPRDVEGATDSALALLGIEDLADRPAEGLTVGHLRRLEVARALAARPLLLLADEPCAGLNPAETDAMIAALRRIRDGGVTIWLVEHDMRAVMGVCDRILVIAAGRAIAEGTPGEVAADPAVIAAYLGAAEESRGA
ncbi:ABC transporter ATP-binding protein [Caldovatus sediminis]|uniref:ABC transporter ATP-binding protein n=1 Tax=Caldovatus sediminis TaxID=2041189 RepID=A0A8J3EB68_9PROT|nr:ABC transporter ATP-binding protein [Caldovatus sediminis]GGG23719.1 ABC transporter ATP-binding protein [Caldovatus sediminis]